MCKKKISHSLKKAVLLITIIIAPFLIYLSILIYSHGKHGIIKLPVIRERPEITFSNLLKPEKSQYSSFVTLVSFLDHSLKENEVILFNLYELILKENAYPDFQLLAFVSHSQQLDMLIKKMRQWDESSDLNWKIIPMDSLTMRKNRLILSSESEMSLYPSQVFIIDKDLNQRRRLITAGQTQKSGYEATSIAVLKKEMSDDIRITVAEYRLALKENNKYSIGDQ